MTTISRSPRLIPSCAWIASVLIAMAAFMLGRADAAATHKGSDEATELDALIVLGTPDALATASLLAHLVQSDDSEQSESADPSALIQKAVALAPNRPELIWLQLRDCEQRRCPDQTAIAGRLQALDRDNGLAWLSDLRPLPNLEAAGITRTLTRIAAGEHPRVYWNKLAVMMFGALTHHDRSRPATAITRDADDRLTHVTSILAAVTIPALQSLAHACRLDQFDLPGRRSACEAVMTRLQSSDAALVQDLSVTLQESWWPEDSSEYAALRTLYLQQRYLTVESNRERQGRADRDAELRVAAMRRLEREDEVERTLLSDFHEPLERPSSWRMPADAP